MGRPANAGSLFRANQRAIHSRFRIEFPIGAGHHRALYGAEWIWNERIQGKSPTAHPPADSYPDLAAVRAPLEKMDQYFIDYAGKITTEQLQQVIHYKTSTGQEFSNPLWQTLHQLSNHATYHRGQITTLLRQLDAKPVNTDLIAYYRVQAATAKASTFRYRPLLLGNNPHRRMDETGDARGACNGPCPLASCPPWARSMQVTCRWFEPR